MLIICVMVCYSDFESAFGGNQGQHETKVDERLKNIDPKMVELIRSEIMDNRNTVTWDDIAGLEFAKATIQVSFMCSARITFHMIFAQST